MKKKVSSMLLAFCLCFSLLPATAFAASAAETMGGAGHVEELNLSKQTSDVSGSGYAWDAETKTLTLTGADIGSLILPDSPHNAYSVTINTAADSAVQSLGFEASGSYVYGCNLVVSGTGALTVGDMISHSMPGSILTVNQGATLNANGGIALSTSGGNPTQIIVNGTLNAASEFSYALYTYRMKIGSTGSVDVSGPEGVSINASSNPAGAFTLERGGHFHGNCENYNLSIVNESWGKETLPLETAKTWLVLPSNYIPEPFELMAFTDDNGGFQGGVTVADPATRPGLSAGSIENAGGSLTLAPVSKPEPQPQPGLPTPPMYEIEVLNAENGTVVSDHERAVTNGTVILDVTAKDGYRLRSLTVSGKDGTQPRVTKQNGVYTFRMPAADVTVKGEFVPSNLPFVDVPEDSYYRDSVEWANDNKITTGIDASHFAPDMVCTRAQAVTFLWRAEGCPAPTVDASPFADVEENSWYETAVLWATEKGITKGTSETTFSPDKNCSRAEIVTLLWRNQGAPSVASDVPFTDVTAGSWYAEAVQWAVKNEVTMGTSETTFSPTDDCTRAQIVTFLYRSMAK